MQLKLTPANSRLSYLFSRHTLKIKVYAFSICLPCFYLLYKTPYRSGRQRLNSGHKAENKTLFTINLYGGWSTGRLEGHLLFNPLSVVLPQSLLTPGRFIFISSFHEEYYILFRCKHFPFIGMKTPQTVFYKRTNINISWIRWRERLFFI